MTPTITAFKASPDRGRGLARDMRVRWALEEVGQAYEVELVTFQQMKEEAYLAQQPFGQIPAYREGELVLFESAAIVLRIAETQAGQDLGGQTGRLLPQEADARSRAIMWMFSAVGTMDPPIMEFVSAKLFERDHSWWAARLPFVETRLRARLSELSERLGDGEWLDAGFSAGDLMMVHVLMRLQASGLLDGYANLAAYVKRGQARPAYQRAFAAQLAVFEAAQAGA